MRQAVARYPYPPGPYRSRLNLPSVFLGLPFALLRSKLYPKFIDPTVSAVEAFPEVSPFAFLPTSGSYNKHPMPAMIAVSEARARLQNLARIGRDRAPADMPATDFPVPLAPSTDRMYASPPPGYDVRNVPFEGDPGAIPGAVARTAFILEQSPWSASPAGGVLDVNHPTDIIRRMQQPIIDLFGGGGG